MKLELGCGPIRREGFLHVDNNPICKPDVLMDMQEYVKDLDDGSVDQIFCMNAIEFLDGWELYEFMNHLHRILKFGSTLKVAVTSVTMPGGAINPRAWTVPLLKTHFSPDTFKCFIGGPTEEYRGVKPWIILGIEHYPSGGLEVEMIPKKKNPKKLTEVQQKVQDYREILEEGISSRIEILINDGGNNPEVETQLKNWREELDVLMAGGFEDHVELVQKPVVSDSQCKRVDIICLKYKEEEQEIKCMTQLITQTKWPHKVTWYDSRNQSANFSKLWNHLTEVSTCDYVLIMDSDAYVETEGWLTRMMASFESNFQCTLGPHSNMVIHPKQVGIVVPVTRDGAASTIQGRIAHNPDAMPFTVSEQVSGFFFLFKKEVWEELGGFDERFYLHGQDSEWIDRVIESNWDIVVRPDVYVDHEVSASISKAAEAGEFNYDVDIAYTRMVYDVIRDEKERGVYEHVR